MRLPGNRWWRHEQLVWREIHSQRPVAVHHLDALLRLWAADPRQPRVVWEVRSDRNGVRFFVGAPERAAGATWQQLTTSVPSMVLTDAKKESRSPVHAAARLHLRGVAVLRTDEPEQASNDLLAALMRPLPGEHLVVQLLLGPRKTARLLPPRGEDELPARHAAVQAQQRESGFALTCRLGVTSTEPGRQRSLIAGIFMALRTRQAPSSQLLLTGEPARRLNDARSPWRWPLSLNWQELLGLLAAPLGESAMPGFPAAQARRLPPSRASLAVDAGFLQAAAPGYEGRLLGLDEAGLLHHSWILGPTGSGKSTLLLHRITADMAAGRGVVVIEPKGDLVQAVLACVPRHRQDDVIVLDPADGRPAGLNPLVGSGTAAVRAEGLLAVFRALYADSWGPRTQDILQASLLTLLRRPDASLPMVPLLLTNNGFRRHLVERAAQDDPIALGPFWSWYEGMSDGERAAAIAPVMNKLRAFLLSPALRSVLGQTAPAWDISEVLDGKILLAPLGKGSLGSASSQLLGSLLVAQLWQAVLARGQRPARQRPAASIVIDEMQDFLHLPTDLGDALAQARGLGVGFTLAHQHLGQLPAELRAGLLANARSRICFRLPADDAAVMAKGHPELSASDLSGLDAFHAYASLFAAGRSAPYALVRTRREPAVTSDAQRLRARSRERYGREAAEIDAEITNLVQPRPSAGDAGQAVVTNRRRRSS